MGVTADRSVFRILDAAANRAAEGLRTMEEYARFLQDDAAAASEWKSLRHDLAAAIARLPRADLIAARDTSRDVGTGTEGDSEYRRMRVSDVLAAAASRTQQAIRCLEEYGKVIDGDFAKVVEAIRYRCYTVCRDAELSAIRASRVQRLQAASVYVLIDCRESIDAFVSWVKMLVTAGAGLVQLRDPSADDRTLFERARAGAKAVRDTDSLFIVNDRCDLAVAADADGAHVGQEELPAAEARRLIGEQRLLGLSTHDLAQAKGAESLPVDYIGCGPTFPGTTKNFSEFPGVAFLKEVAGEISLPAFAIGGIHPGNLDQVIAAGVRRVAVTGAVRDAEEPGAVVQEMRRRLEDV
ncbi:MAG: thiamine phosphate synthase [Planctomycetota bacterium]